METKILEYLENLLECEENLLSLNCYNDRDKEHLEIRINLLEEIIHEIKNNI